MDWQPHPGFGVLYLMRDGVVPDGWYEFCDWPTRTVYVSGSFEMRDHKTGGMKTVEYADFEHVHLAEALTLADIEAAVADDPVHYFCTACHPHADRAICGARMRGEDLGCDARPTCVVCAGMTDCPNHTGRTS